MPTADRPHMPGYGIAGPEAGLLPWSWAEERLRDAWRYWVVTVSGDGEPHAMPVWAVGRMFQRPALLTRRGSAS